MSSQVCYLTLCFKLQMGILSERDQQNSEQVAHTSSSCGEETGFELRVSRRASSSSAKLSSRKLGLSFFFFLLFSFESGPAADTGRKVSFGGDDSPPIGMCLGEWPFICLLCCAASSADLKASSLE